MICYYLISNRCSKRISLKKEESLIVFANDRSLLTCTQTMAQIYNEHKDEDGFLYDILWRTPSDNEDIE